MRRHPEFYAIAGLIRRATINSRCALQSPSVEPDIILKKFGLQVIKQQRDVLHETTYEENTIELEAYSGIVWRIMFADQSEQMCEPVSSPIGRFHHSEQVALYISCTEEGAGVAIKRYLKPEDPERIIVPLQVNANRIFDIRKTDFSNRASMVWQDIVAKGEPAPTWRFSDTAREAEAQGMLYASRSRPDLTHLVLFDVSNGIVKQAGNSKAWFIKAH